MKKEILNILKGRNVISLNYELSDFLDIYENENSIIYVAYGGDMLPYYDKIIYDKFEKIIYVYDINNFYGNEYLSAKIIL